jgi:hypothetical protein
MKIKYSVILAVCFLACLAFLVANQNKNSQWKGKIEYKDGVKVFKNPNEPLYGEITFELEEDLSIGNEEDENYIFYRLGGIAVDSEKNIFVLDGGECRVQKFDREGNYLQTIGRKGQGPGEFEQPLGLFLDSDEMIYVRDTLRRNIHIFGKDGRFKETIKPQNDISSYFGITKKRNILTIHTPRTYVDMKRLVVLMDMEGKILKEIAAYPYQRRPRIKGHSLGNPYEHRLYLFTSNDGKGIYAHSFQYRIYILNTLGNLSHVIEVDKHPESITKKEKENQIENYLKRRKQLPIEEPLSRSEVKKAYIFPEFKPYFKGFNRDDKCRIYVRMFKLYNPKDSSEKFDVFSREGYYIYRVNMKIFPNIIDNGYIYNIEHEQETGYTKIKRYKIKNWNQIRKSI